MLAGMGSTLSMIDQYGFSESEKGALVALATSYGGDFSTLLNSIVNDYVRGDQATVAQVQTYQRGTTPGPTLSASISPIWVVVALIGAYLVWKS